MTEATLLRAGARPILRFERHLSRPVEAVWRAVTDPAEMRAWFPTRIEIAEWKQGAELTHHFDEHDIDPLPGNVLDWDPPRHVRFTWGTDTIGFELTPAPDGGTIFVLTEELGASIAARNAAGWESCLDRLEFGEERQPWQARFDQYAAAFRPVLGDQDGPPTRDHNGVGLSPSVRRLASIAPAVTGVQCSVKDPQADSFRRAAGRLGSKAFDRQGSARQGLARQGLARQGRGRQAEARRNDDAVLEAARVVFATQGPDAPMSAVAAQAGVGMGSLYRRFATKAEMLDFLCEASLRQQAEIAEAALALPDPLAALAAYVTGCVELRVGVFTLLADQVTPSAGTRALARQAHGLLERIVTRAQGAGGLRADVSSVDIYRLIELFSRRRPGEPQAHQRLVALALDGMRAPGCTALPGDQPTWAEYAREWQDPPTRPA